MLEIIQVIVLGIVQGVTEFMPISSSAHLIIVPWAFGWPIFGIGFDVALHWGTLIAVITYFRHDLLRYIRALFTGLPNFSTAPRFGLTTGGEVAPPGGGGGLGEGDEQLESDRRIAWLLLLATIPGAVAGVLLESRIDEAFHRPESLNSWAIYAIAGMLMGVGLILWLAERLRQGKGKPITGITFVDGMIIGVAQALALFPGVSRSGATITAGLFRGLTRADAARFSFLLSTPIVLAAGLKKLYDFFKDKPVPGHYQVSALSLGVGFLVSLIAGYLTISFLLNYLQRRSTAVFVIYRLLLGVALIVLALLRARG